MQWFIVSVIDTNKFEPVGNNSYKNSLTYFYETKKSAEKAAINFANANPGKEVYVYNACKLVKAAPGPVTSFLVTDKGEVLPE